MGISFYPLASLTCSVFRWTWPHLGQTDTTLLPGVAREVLCVPLYTLPVSQSWARETYWPHSSLCGRKLSDPLPVLFKRLNSGWLWPRRLAVRPSGGTWAPSVHFKHEPHHPRPGRVLKLLRAAGHDATAQELLSTYIHLDPGRKHRGVTYRASFISKHFQRGQKGEWDECRSTRDSSEARYGLLPVSAIPPHKSLMNFLQFLWLSWPRVS